MERVLLFQDKSDAEFVKIIEQHIAALNKALQGIPRDCVRLTHGRIFSHERSFGPVRRGQFPPIGDSVVCLDMSPIRKIGNASAC